MPAIPHNISSDHLPAFSIIIPARNEAANLPALLASIRRSQSQPAEIIVVDDDSEDGTAGIAKAYGATVIQSSPLPAGWTGKTWACWQGAAAATADIFLFLDADTFFAPERLTRLLAFFCSQPRKAALSVLPYHRTERPYEELSLFFNLLMAAGTGGFSGLDSPKLFGQSLLLHRELYFKSGGHEIVCRHVLENLHLSAHIAAAGGTSSAVIGFATLTMRMFPEGLAQLSQSWRKGFAGGAGVISPRILLLSIYWLSAAASAALMLALGMGVPRIAAFIFYLAFAAQIGWVSRRLGSYRWTTALAYPIPLLFYFAVFGSSMWSLTFDHPVEWKGRQL